MSALRPTVVIPYGVALAITVVATIFFGWAGFWLGVAVFVLVRLGRWGLPLIRLSYTEQPRTPDSTHPRP